MPGGPRYFALPFFPYTGIIIYFIGRNKLEKIEKDALILCTIYKINERQSCISGKSDTAVGNKLFFHNQKEGVGICGF